MNVSLNLDTIRQKLSGKKISILLVVLSYLFFTVMYMGPSVWNCKDTLYGFGDNTAGPIWRFGLEPKQPPLGTVTHATNFPVGEELYTPAYYSQSGQAAAIWATSRVLGPNCGYNVINMTGFMISALTMFGFIYAITRRKWIAWLAGYAVSFSPYYQMKVGGHPGYGYQALLIGAAWAFYNLVKRRRKRDAGYLAILTAASFYFDPYFSLLLIGILLPLISTWFVILYIRSRKIKKNKTAEMKRYFQLLLWSGAILILLLAPLIIVTVRNSKQITSGVAAVRGNVFAEAKACSNLPYEYAIPSGRNKVFEKIGGRTAYTDSIKNLHEGYTCGIGEDTVGLSLVVMTVTFIGLIILAWEKINKRRTNLNLGYESNLVVIGMCLVALCAVAIALPPVNILGIAPSPSYLLLKITTTWRTLTRFYVDINFAVITLFSVVLLYFSKFFKRNSMLAACIFIAIFLGIFIEYLAFKPFTGNDISTFSYKTNVPTSYTWLSEQEGIKTIAEYPIEKSGGESNAMAYYLTMQNVHKKALFNGNVPTTHEEDLRSSLKDISDPQTQDVLGSLGIDAVVIHGVSESDVRKIEGLEVIYTAKHQRFNMSAFTPLVTNDNVVIAKIKKTPTKNMMQLSKGFARNATIIKSAADWNFEALNNSEISIVAVPGQKKTSSESALRCFEVRMSAEDDSAKLTILADGKVAVQKQITSEYQPIQVNAKDKIVIKNSTGHNMQVRNLGCSY